MPSLFPVVALAAAWVAARDWTAGHLPGLLAAIRRADPVVAGVRLTHSLPLGVKRDTSQP